MQHATNPTPAILIERPTNPGTITAEQLAGAFIAGFSSPHTRRSYRVDLRAWMEFCRRYQLDPLRVRRAHVDVYVRELQGKGYATSTWGHRLTTLKSFFAWCCDEEVMDHNPAARVRAPKQQRPPMPSLTKHELHRFLNVAPEVTTSHEHAAVLLMALGALRVSEVCGANIADLLRHHSWMPELYVRGKGGKDRTIVVTPAAMAPLEEAVAGRQVGPLLLNRAGNRMHGVNAWRTVRRVAAAAGFADRELHPHALRRSAIEIALDAGQDIREVQVWVGHSKAETTIYYDRRATKPERSPAWAVQAAVA